MFGLDDRGHLGGADDTVETKFSFKSGYTNKEAVFINLNGEQFTLPAGSFVRLYEGSAPASALGVPEAMFGKTVPSPLHAKFKGIEDKWYATELAPNTSKGEFWWVYEDTPENAELLKSDAYKADLEARKSRVGVANVEGWDSLGGTKASQKEIDAGGAEAEIAKGGKVPARPDAKGGTDGDGTGGNGKDKPRKDQPADQKDDKKGGDGGLGILLLGALFLLFLLTKDDDKKKKAKQAQQADPQPF